MPDRCPGAANLRTPALSIKKCPQCGEEVAVFSNDTSVMCRNCGLVICNNIISCVRWCSHAKECVGGETYGTIMAQLKA